MRWIDPNNNKKKEVKTEEYLPIYSTYSITQIFNTYLNETGLLIKISYEHAWWVFTKKHFRDQRWSLEVYAEKWSNFKGYTCRIVSREY